MTGKLYSYDPNGQIFTPVDDSRENRIEALRAASRIVAGCAASGRPLNDKDTGEEQGFGEATKILAEQFAKWLEGER